LFQVLGSGFGLRPGHPIDPGEQPKDVVVGVGVDAIVQWHRHRSTGCCGRAKGKVL
jgi:hypothetical protein